MTELFIGKFFLKKEDALFRCLHRFVALSEKRDLLKLLRILKGHNDATFRHSVNVAYLSFLIAHEIGLTTKEILQTTVGGLLHDIGKIRIPADILEKKTKLTKQEWGLIKMHPQYGVDVLASFPWAKEINGMIACHHERMDGRGYLGIEGDRIPLGSRIISVADAFDAMVSLRSYHRRRNLNECCEELITNCGTQFDPLIARKLILITFKKSQSV